MYAVQQENGEAVTQEDYAISFLQFGYKFKAVYTANLGNFILVEYKKDDIDYGLMQTILRSIHYLVRLHHGTGIDFHHLNLLLTIPGTTAGMEAGTESGFDEDGNILDDGEYNPDDPKIAKRHLTDTGLRVLAGYLMHRETYDLSPEAYVALFYDVCPYWRADQIVAGEDDTTAGLEQTEISFMRELFADDAPWLQQTLIDATTPITDPRLAASISRGLGLSAFELDSLVQILTAFNLTHAVDAHGLGALYRLSKLFKLVEWPVITGIKLLSLLTEQAEDNYSLLQSLTVKNKTPEQTDNLCSAIDTLIGLSRWMQDAELSANDLLHLLTPTPIKNLRATDEDHQWFKALTTLVEPVVITANRFAEFEHWYIHKQNDDTTVSTKTTVITADAWYQALLSNGTLYNAQGIFHDYVENETINAACAAYLSDYVDINSDDERNRRQLHRLQNRLQRLRDEQVLTLQRQLATLNPSLKNSVDLLIRWTQNTGHHLLHTLLAGTDDATALYQLYEMRRYISVYHTMDMGDIGLWLMGTMPHWLTSATSKTETNPLTAGPITLAQLYYLHRFNQLQIGSATDAAWRGYLTLANEPSTEPSEEWRQTSQQALAILLECSVDDIVAYSDHLFGPDHSPANTIYHIDALARHVRLANKLHSDAQSLLALKAVADSRYNGDWTAAKTVSLSALSQVDDGTQLQAFQHAFAEKKRDALLATYRQTTITQYPELDEQLHDRDSLYHHLLLDVSVTSAVPTSYLVEAISSLQLYITRALDGSEPGIGFYNRNALVAQWEIDKNYRLWEANQKLALYPQNYIEPELRYQTSPQFDEFLQSVSGSNLDESGAESAVNNYMAGLANACSLSVCSLYVEQLADGINNNYHILARADWEQGRFFYRKLEADFKTIAELQQPDQYLKALDWSFWQEVDIPTTYTLFSDIAFCVFQNRYFFFWLELEERRSQTTSKEETIYRLHPRYMRCDAKSLTGPTYTPGLFEHKETNTVSVSSAFEWRNTKPSIRTTYHPSTLKQASVYGEGNDDDDPSAALKDVISTTFGITIKNGDKVQENSLRIRLTNEWADAIYFPDKTINTRLQDATPKNFVCVHPEPSAQSIAEQKTIAVDKEFSMNNQWYRHNTDVQPDVMFYERWVCQRPQATFQQTTDTDGYIGTIEISFLDDRREHYLVCLLDSKTDKAGYFSHVHVRDLSKLEWQTTLSVNDPNLKDSVTSATSKEKNELWYSPDIKDISFKKEEPTILASANEQRKSIIKVPSSWLPKSHETRKIDVTLTVNRSVGDYELDWYTRSKEGRLSLFDNIEKKVLTIDIGSIYLELGFAKINTAWAVSNVHGSRNFLHLVNADNTPINKSLLVMNSSSALASLAQSMPRPGNFRDVFTINNQKLPEELGTFTQDFSKTLARIYPDDTTTLNMARTPKSVFSFDAAYGGYGWEVFYHIPSALAASYADNGQFDHALRWFEKIYNPKLQTPWQVLPLANAEAPENGLTFNIGDTIVDPDRIAMDYPIYYQQTTIRQYLETLLAAGDSAYKEQTQETLTQAKALYVSAKQLFSDQLPTTLNTLTNEPWANPSLGEVANDKYAGFLPPFNQELHTLYNTFNARLENLRQWLDIDGNPLNIPLLSAVIDPSQLQKTAKARLTLNALDYQDEDAQESLIDFITVARTVRQYISNLKTTSSRLQAALEKADGTKITHTLRINNTHKIKRELALQDFTIDITEKEVDIKIANLTASTSALKKELVANLIAYVEATKASVKKVKNEVILVKTKVKSKYTLMSTGIQARIPTIFGTSSGGANITAAGQVQSNETSRDILELTYRQHQDNADEKKKAKFELFKTNIAELSSKIASASLELKKVNLQLDKEKKQRDHLNEELSEAEEIVNLGKASFGNNEFYEWLVADLEQLLTEEWSTTLEFCRLLANLFEDETGQSGQSFIKTTNLGNDKERFNAPYRLALDIERLEMAYTRVAADQESQSSRLTFSLSEVPSLNSQRSVLDILVEQGEAYFELNEDMFDALYPGQYDRRIVSVEVNFPGLAKAGLSPHGRLTQIANTRYASRERDPNRGGKIRNNRYALQSIMLGAAQVDTSTFDYPDGLLKRFQNTGVESRWLIAIPSISELNNQASGKTQRKAATKHLEKMTSHLDEIEFKVTFSGRW